jgi:hypothetical protein
MFFLLIERGDLFQSMDDAIDADTHESRFAGFREYLAKFPLTIVRLRGQEQSFSALGKRQKFADNGASRPGSHSPTAKMAPLLTHAGVQHAQIIVDFRDGADGRSRVRRSRLLFDGNGRRQTADMVILGFF